MPRRRRNSSLGGVSLLGILVVVVGLLIFWYLVGSGGRPSSGATTGNGSAASSVGGSLASAGIVVANGKGWSGNRLDGTVPAAGACHEGHEGDQVLPDRRCTPGAIDPTVTQANLDQTICRKGGYTSTVRPPSSVTEPVKRDLLRSYDLSGSLSEYEIDHLISLELGGASDVRNLWPEQNIGSPKQFDSSGTGINAKDGVENRLHAAVCSGQVTLAVAQEAIATDWYTAESRLHLQP